MKAPDYCSVRGILATARATVAALLEGIAREHVVVAADNAGDDVKEMIGAVMLD